MKMGKIQLGCGVCLGLIGAAGVISMGGCQHGFIFQEQVVRTDDLLAVPGPFRPTVMRVHPLTHTEMNADGEPVMILHVELKDLWGDTVKGIGQLQVQLRRQGSAGDVGNRGTRWDVDLRDVEENVSYFDSATRTYRVVIGGLPDWLGDSVRNTEDSSGSVGARVRVLFRTAKADGETVVLQDEYVLR
ncbi:MAG: hypothetical protein ACWA5W_04005 [Phycisphaerales bacterium]